ncbi:Predicted arabinose efflux permease, MFS family [Pelagirhabdus alkalitolerans]|uniref:Predicted arabinose efflux permease, MFS family n=1 Tax=Pelagirhabdus alkalitolerans TaxID=1612202 RepID=A0A1G6ILI7_9BACI|nr:MFS transporter [Pelagirhabdus alkalitolerans]SDC07379.1 Predicted arabinose efflux permease, MFS family [Pelagirhabdus alkalitolerans]
MSTQQEVSFKPYFKIATAASFLMGSAAIIFSALSFFVEPVTSYFGFSRTAFTLTFTITSLIQVLSMPIIGRALERFSLKRIFLVSGATSSVGLIGYSFSSSIISFYLFSLLIGILVPAFTALGSVVLINRWFVKKKGTVLGISGSFTGVFGAIFSLIIPNFIEQFGFQAAYLFLGITLITIVSLTVIFLVDNSPESVGLIAYGANDDDQQSKHSIGETPSIRYRDAIKSPVFFMLYIGFILITFIGAFQQHLPAFFGETGLPSDQVGTLFSLLMIALIFAKIIAGALNDRLGPLMTIMIHISSAIVAFILLITSTSYLMMILMVILYSFGLSIMNVLLPLLSHEVFGPRDYSQIWSLLATGITVGVGVGTPLWGMIYDLTGAYTIGLYGMIFILLTVMTLFNLAYFKSKKLKQSNQHTQHV